MGKFSFTLRPFPPRLPLALPPLLVLLLRVRALLSPLALFGISFSASFSLFLLLLPLDRPQPLLLLALRLGLLLRRG